jgi:glycosyltransferase involved in cell wall biosynthesis
MKSNPLVSIIINNYNYDRFLAEAIDSALNQTYTDIEVIVVDDGSTDNSHKIISSYGDRIIPVLKSNGGQCSAINAGFSVCKGEIICFLDADDVFHNEKVATLVRLFSITNVIDNPIIFHNSFEVIDEKSLLVSNLTVNNVFSNWSFLSEIRNDCAFFEGEIHEVCSSTQVYKFISKYRHLPHIGMPTSSFAISRSMAYKIFPLPISKEKHKADTLIVQAASIIGSVYSTNLNLTRYRFHDSNDSQPLSGGRKNTREEDELIHRVEDEYLNSKLKELGLQLENESIFSYMESMPANGFYKNYYGYRSGDYLIRLAFKVVRWHVNLTTLNFFLETLCRGIYYKFLKSKLFKSSTNPISIS